MAAGVAVLVLCCCDRAHATRTVLLLVRSLEGLLLLAAGWQCLGADKVRCGLNMFWGEIWYCCADAVASRRENGCGYH